jgi:hypothetical protein
MRMPAVLQPSPCDLLTVVYDFTFLLEVETKLHGTWLLARKDASMVGWTAPVYCVRHVCQAHQP